MDPIFSLSIHGLYPSGETEEVLTLSPSMVLHLSHSGMAERFEDDLIRLLEKYGLDGVELQSQDLD